MDKKKEFFDELLEINDFIVPLIRQIPLVIKETKEKEDLIAEEKSDYRDIVTAVDKAVENYFTNELLSVYPKHFVLGEETYKKEIDYSKEDLWIIDPIDGTTNFFKLGKNFCTIISYFKNSVPCLAYIYDPINDNLYHSIKGRGVFKNGKKLEKAKDRSLKDSLISMDIRRMYMGMPELFGKLVTESFATRNIGSAGLDGLSVILGERGAYVHSRGGAWDFSAFHLMASEMGLSFSNFNRKQPDLTSYSSFILAFETAYEDIMKFL